MNQRHSMKDHFARLAPEYGGLRTTDEEPVLYIRTELAGRKSVEAADIGCGTGRYDLLLLQHLPNLHLICVDQSPRALEELKRYLAEHALGNFETVLADIDDLQLEDSSLDVAFCFNAVHHFDFTTFITKAGSAIRADGRIFIYTRTPAQNAETIWGKYFPAFLEKETRLHTLEEMEGWLSNVGSLELIATKTFRYRRRSSVERLRSQARSAHYSTFVFYGEAEFARALATFEDRIRRHADGFGMVEWFDYNTMLVVTREAPRPT
jgi:SAM-dependent methyltransferase